MAWVRLNNVDDMTLTYINTDRINGITVDADGNSVIWTGCEYFTVRESPAKIMRLIADARGNTSVDDGFWN